MHNFDDIIRELSAETVCQNYGHSRFQIEHFIIGSQPTDYGKYKQCVLELRTRVRTYENLVKELSKTDDIAVKSQYEIYLEDIKREIYIFYEILCDVKGKINFDDLEELEKDYWNRKLEQELLSHWLVGSVVPISLVHNVMCLPNDFSAKQKLLNFLNVQSKDLKVIEDDGQDD